eukprot:gene18918-25799_t
MLRDFWQRHPAAESVLRQWHTIVEQADFRDFEHIKEFFNSADYVPPYVVFDVAGNNYRVVVVVHYRAKRIYVREFNMRAIQSSWSKLDSMVHLRPIYDEAGYEQMTSLMNSLLDVVGNNEDHALSGLLELVGDL